ncbi:hypothetical protein [Salinibaculum salinum]|uniref:DUF7857 domain-containing protein n=1 Tax=Salinibaculum salinum TaxID=3131996 RepID=UPI0030EEC924
MVSLTCDTTAAGAATLVSLTLSSAEPIHVRVENCLDGPVWPPRKQGVPAAGWDEEGFSGVVDGRLALGYACPADPADQPAHIVEERPPADEAEPTARSLVRELGDASPPRDAVGPTVDAIDAVGPDPRERNAGTDSPPPAVSAWLEEVEQRLAHADRLDGATSVSEAADAVDAVGGPDEVRTLRDRLATDREALVAVAERCESIADSAETVEIPVETLAHLA